ncbi:carbohydrate-binding protein [Enterococcus sp. CWB-B31]|uniref:carbohydrate-binding protein n=1 Tax=Enterococcus sp. CWB-B31 TaxID=2885159 RepID=UPI001E5B04B5|nr:carbohydrate-binding protein [Enterococcus sp. CWB-B31]MCB5955106.1 carbohydrate-binding protein [Enterococcus sp. CWB-B31]
MKKKSKFFVLVFTFMVFALAFLENNTAAYAESKDFYPPVNIVTVENEKSALPESITYLSEDQKISQDNVSWDSIDESIFSKAGTYEIQGIAKKTNAKVKGIITIFPSDQKVKVAAIGDSITYGMNVENALINSYPRQLGYRLGSNYDVVNYGNSGKTLLNNGNDPYIRTSEYKNSLAVNQNIVIIQLGTNDTKPYNFIKIDNYINDYVNLINAYKAMETKPVVYVCLPPKVVHTNYDISNENLKLILPKILESAKKADVDVSVIDNNSITQDADILIPDGVHPNARGAALLANNVYARLKGKSEVISGIAEANDYYTAFGSLNTYQNNSFYIGGIVPDAWISYKNVDLSVHKGSIQLFSSIPYDNTTVTIRKGAVDGEIIGEKKLTRSGSLNTWLYHTVELTENTGIADIYVSFSRPSTSAITEIANLGAINFGFDEKKPLEIHSFSELQTAINSNITNLKLMADISFTTNLQLKDNTKLDLNDFTLNTANYYFYKDEALGRKISVDVRNGIIQGQNPYGSFYSADSTNANYGMNLSFSSIAFEGTLLNRGLSKETVVEFKNVQRSISSISSNNTFVYKEVDLGKNLGSIQLYASVPYDNTTVTLRTDSTDGPIIGQKILTHSGNINTWLYHTIDLKETEGIHDIYVTVNRPLTGETVELARLGFLNFAYDENEPTEIRSFTELQTAISSNLTNLKLMTNIQFTTNLQLKDNTKLDLNDFTLNTANYYFYKDEALGRKISVDVRNGIIQGQNPYGSFYSVDSTNANYGMNLLFSSISFEGQLLNRGLSKETVVTFENSQNTKSSISPNNTFIYKNIDLDGNLGSIQLNAAVPYDNTTMTVRVDSADGPIIGEKVLTRTGNVNTWVYHTIDLAKTNGIHDIYVTVSRPSTSETTELAYLGSINFTYDQNSPTEIRSFTELQTAINSNLTNLQLMTDLQLTANIQLQDDTVIDLNGYTLNTASYYLTKNELLGKRINLTIKNGHVLGQNNYGSIYSGDSANQSYGMNVNVQDIQFDGTLFIRQNVTGAVVSFEGDNEIRSTKGSNVYAQNVTFKTGSTYKGTTEGGGSSNDSGSTVISMGNSNTQKEFIVEENAIVELYPGYSGTGYGQNAVYGFSLLQVQENASFTAKGNGPMLRTEYTAGNAKVEVLQDAVFDVSTSLAAEGFSFSHGIDYVFNNPAYFSIESLNTKRFSFMYAYRASSFTYHGKELKVWETADTAGEASKKWTDIDSMQLTNILNGNNMGTLTTSNEMLLSKFGSLNNYYRISNQ